MLGLAISKDNGITFKKVSDGPILGIDYYDSISIGNIAIIKNDNQWHMYYTNLTEWIIEGAKPTYEYNIKYAHSNNGILWNKTNEIIINKSKKGGVATPTIFKKGNVFHMFFGYRKIYGSNMKVGGYNIGYASSKDLIKWTRNDKRAGIFPSEKGWDSEMICYPSIIEVNKKVFMFYCGNGFGESGFGVAELSEF